MLFRSDISKDGSYLAIGYSTGKIAMWNLTYESLSGSINDTHKSTIICVSFLNGPKLWIISSDSVGCVFLTSFAAAIFGLSGTSYLLLKDCVAFNLVPLKENFIVASHLSLCCRVFGGLVRDVKRKAPFYWSDVVDAFSLQCVASVLFLYCACMSPVITFGGLLGEATKSNIVSRKWDFNQI